MQKYKGEEKGKGWGGGGVNRGEGESMKKARRIIYEAIWMCGY